MGFTFFFRDTHSLQQSINILIENLPSSTKLKVWDAGCERGPEPITFAILLAETIDDSLFNNFEFQLSDLDENNTFIDIIHNGIYNFEEIKRIPEEFFTKYFKDLGSEKYQLIPKIHNKLKFVKHDLLTLNPVGKNYNLIICKNVLLHFHPDERIKVINMYYDSLNDNGLLLFEQTQKMPDDLNNKFTKVTSDASLYRKLNI
jgi:chemotaxis protein methyltransferase CheR